MHLATFGTVRKLSSSSWFSLRWGANKPSPSMTWGQKQSESLGSTCQKIAMPKSFYPSTQILWGDHIAGPTSTVDGCEILHQLGWNPINHGINHLLYIAGAGFRNHPQYVPSPCRSTMPCRSEVAFSLLRSNAVRRPASHEASADALAVA